MDYSVPKAPNLLKTRTSIRIHEIISLRYCETVFLAFVSLLAFSLWSNIQIKVKLSSEIMQSYVLTKFDQLKIENRRQPLF